MSPKRTKRTRCRTLDVFAVGLSILVAGAGACSVERVPVSHAFSDTSVASPATAALTPTPFSVILLTVTDSPPSANTASPVPAPTHSILPTEITPPTIHSPVPSLSPSSPSPVPAPTAGILPAVTKSTTDLSNAPSVSELPLPTPTVRFLPPSINPTSTVSRAPPASEFLLIPTPTPRVALLINSTWLVSPSLDEQIYGSDVIVRVSLLSVAAMTETVPSGEGVAHTYRGVQELRFTAHEYLKGTGPSEAHVVVRSVHRYLNEARAQQIADEAVSQRNTTWDDRQGVLFLRTRDPRLPQDEVSGASQRADAPAFAFPDTNPVVQSEWDYAIDTLSRVWLPANSTGGDTGRSADGAGMTFITDGSASPPPVISLDNLRSRIADMAATLEAGANIAGYKTCIYKQILRERVRRANPWTPIQKTATIASGLAAGTEIRKRHISRNHPQYHRPWLSGPDMEFFQALIVDDDSEPDNGYDRVLSTARPLSVGEYRVLDNQQHYVYLICNFVPTDAYDDWTVTVTSPAGTLHEAFFDPVTIGSAVGADGTNGVLEPAGFSVGGTTTTISGLKWENGTVTMTLSPSCPWPDAASTSSASTGQSCSPWCSTMRRLKAAR